VLAQLYEKHPDDVRLVYRHFPLPGHSLSISTAAAAEAAGRQGKFWEMSEHIFATQEEWAGLPEDQFATWAAEQAKTLGLDVEKFQADMQSQAVRDKVKAAQDYGIKTEIPGTPFLLLNGLRYDGPRDVASLESILALFKLQDRQFTYCPPAQINPAKQYIAVIQTEKGTIKLQLFPDKAPKAVNSFVFLARNGWYDNITFYQVTDQLALSGDPSGSGMGGPGYSFDEEITDLTFDQAGVVGLVNFGPGSSGSQFFITRAPFPDLNGRYTAFGEVIEGMEVLKKLTLRNPQQPNGPGDKVISITIEEK